MTHHPMTKDESYKVGRRTVLLRWRNYNVATATETFDGPRGAELTIEHTTTQAWPVWRVRVAGVAVTATRRQDAIVGALGSALGV